MTSVLNIEAALSGEEGNSFYTLGGFVMFVLDRIPQAADYFEAGRFRFEVVDMDRNRVDKVLVRHVEQPASMTDTN